MIARHVLRLLPVAALPFVAALGGCTQSEQDADIATMAESLKTCGDYAEMRAQANCTRFVEQGRNPDSAFGKASEKLVVALQKRWDSQCAAYVGDIRTIEMKTTIALTRNGAAKGTGDSVDICAAQAEQELKAYPALANDRTVKR